MNPTISRILVPVDFSPHSDLALRYVIPLAGRLGASVHLLHVVEPLPALALTGESLYLPDVAELEARIMADAERQIGKSRAIVSAAGPAVTAEIASGHAAAEIVRTAGLRKCDLIVMGTHGRTGLAHMFMGSVAEKVTRVAPCPVLTVREAEWTTQPAPSEQSVAAAADR
jgi:nucleotide-binding universal stress UspA family protein